MILRTILIAILSLGSIAYAQNRGPFYSPYGHVHTPKGHLHVLVVIVRFGNFDAMKGNKYWPDSDELPVMARGANNELFSADPDMVGKPPFKMNLSDFYYEMSGGKFIVTADVFPIQVPVTFKGITQRNVHSRQTQVNKLAVDWIAENYPDFDWSKYDNRTNAPRYFRDNSESQPDSLLDYVLFMHRLPGAGGVGTSGRHNIKNTPFKIAAGHTSARSASDAPHNWEHFKHELAHNLFSAPHYNGANGTDGDKYYVQRGWGLMSDTFVPFFTANAWERWWLGWFEPKEIRSAGTYRLRDFVTTGDAIRIQVPGTQDYLWLENHQKTSKWDKRMFYNKERHPQTRTGLYGYVVGEAGADRNRASLQIFRPSHCNLFKYINGEGLWDFVVTGKETPTEGFNARVNRRDKPNPIAGINDLQSLRWDYNSDSVITVGVTHGNVGKKQGESHYIWAEEIKGESKATYNLLGDEKDAYQAGQEISLSGVQPVLNYPSYRIREQRFKPFILNGIRIQIMESDTAGVLLVKVDFDDWEIRKDKRWCGNMILPAHDGERYLDIAEDVKLSMDLSGTCDRIKPHPETGTFANPTVLKVEGGRGIRLRKGSQLIIDNFSELQLDGNSQIIIEKGAKLIVRGAGKLILNDQSQVLVRRKGKLIVEADGYLRVLPQAKLSPAKGGRVKIKR
ncbi:MAG: hypothetical protein AB8F95_02900 [Bacteroidia bacterium]